MRRKLMLLACLREQEEQRVVSVVVLGRVGKLPRAGRLVRQGMDLWRIALMRSWTFYKKGKGQWNKRVLLMP
jgi:hypothetical protein